MRKPRSLVELRNVSVQLFRNQKFLQGSTEPEALQIIQDLIRSIQESRDSGAALSAPERALGSSLVSIIEKEIKESKRSSNPVL